MNRFSRRRLGIVAGGAAAALGVGTADATPSRPGKGPRPTEVRFNMPAGNNPSIANGVAVGSMVAVYTSSGLGPAAANPSAPPGSPEQYVDLSLFPGGVLPAGVTVTEAQAWNTLTRLVANLTVMGLRPPDVITMKCYLKRPAGASDADYAGWNRAYRQFFANTNLTSGDTTLEPLGSAPPAAPVVRNPARPTRSTFEVQSLAAPGWLVEVEVDAVYPAGHNPR